MAETASQTPSLTLPHKGGGNRSWTVLKLLRLLVRRNVRP
jgi:hypothetical protein